jgi:hypothetical protein
LKTAGASRYCPSKIRTTLPTGFRQSSERSDTCIVAFHSDE